MANLEKSGRASISMETQQEKKNEHKSKKPKDREGEREREKKITRKIKKYLYLSFWLASSIHFCLI